MDASAARARAEEIRPQADVPGGFELGSVERRIIRIAARPGDAESVSDRLVWIARFDGGLRAAEVAIDDDTGEVVRVAWSK